MTSESKTTLVMLLVTLAMMFTVLSLLSRCSPPMDSMEPPAYAPPPPLPVFKIEDCEAACAVLQKFDCVEGKTTDNGLTCVEMCQAAIGSGYLYWPSTCVSHAKSREEIQACGVKCN